MYIFFDGDEIGNTMKNLLLNAKVDEASSLSSNINIAMQLIKERLDANNKCEILIWGGDDLLIKLNSSEGNTHIIDEVRKVFYEKTNCTMSGGIGKNIVEAMKNLNIAKNSGKNRVIA